MGGYPSRRSRPLNVGGQVDFLWKNPFRFTLVEADKEYVSDEATP